MEREISRVAAYIRVSTEEQKLHGLSVDAQKAALEDWAAKNGLAIAEFYNDAGFSARKPYSKRPAMLKLLEDVQAKKIDLIIFTKLDRWFRSLPDYYKVQEILERNNVSWKTIQEDYDTVTSSGRLKINIMLSVAQDEADRTSERIRAVNELKRQRLEPLTGECPLGYKIVDKKMVKDPESAPAVAAFFERFLATGSISKAREHVYETYGLKLSYQRAHKILNMPCYCGHYFGVDGMTPPYITREEFEKVQSMRRRVVRKTAQNRIYIFSGLITCGECGARMGGRINTNQETKFYNCTSHYQNMSDCGNKVNLTETKIESFIVATVKTRMEEKKVEYAQTLALQKKRDYKGEIAALQSKQRKLKELFVNDLISLEEYRQDHQSYKAQIEALHKEQAITAVPDFSLSDRLLETGWETAYFELNPEKKQEFWRILLKEIIIYPDRRIDYSFSLPFLSS